MSLVPAFEVGVWNAWIFMVPALLVTIIWFPLMMKKGAPDGSVRAVQRACKSKTALIVASLSKVMLLPAVIYSLFLPLRVGTVWFYVGLPIALLGLVGTILVMLDWANTPTGQPVTRGVYRYSRHPSYVAMFLLLLGVGIASASWVFLLFAIIFGVGVTRPYFVKVEEAQCLGQYGAAYRAYMNRTPQWIGIPKSKEE